MAPRWLPTRRLRLTSRQYRRVLVATLVSLLTSASLLGLIGFMRWRGHQALQSDTHAVIAQASQQLIRALRSRRGTLTFLRDTLRRRPNLTLTELQAMGLSAADHTRHLLGTGVIQPDAPPVWWSGPQGRTRMELAQLTRAILQRARLRGVWRVPSTFVTLTTTAHPLLVMLEPWQDEPSTKRAVIGAFDLGPLLEDFVASAIPQDTPVRLLSGTALLYRSTNWLPANEDSRPIVIEQPLTIDSERWTLQMQPGRSRVVQTLSWFTVLLVSLSVLAGLGVMIVVWLLAARAWILQRAVERRTAALRRTSARLRQMAITDELTGLYNRRFFLERWEWECTRAKRYQRSLACLMIDVNGFKQVNDQLGHQAGDLVLKHVAQELKTALRQSDILARFGGDEFIIALPETTFEQAASVAEKLEQISIPVSEGRGCVPPVSLSVGVSRIEQPDESPEEILQAADQSLYASKRRLKHDPA